MMFPRDLVVRQTSSAYEDDEASTSTPAPATRTRTRTRTPPTPSSNSPTPPASSASLPPTSNSDARENGNGNGSSNGDSGLPINVIVGGTLAGMALAIAIIMAWAYFSRALKRRREVESKKAYWLEATKNNTLHNIAPSNPSMTMRGTGSPHPVSVAVKPANSRVTFTALQVNRANTNHNRYHPHRNPNPKYHHPYRKHSNRCARRSASTPTLVATIRGRGQGWGRQRRRLSPGIQRGRCCSATVTVMVRSSARGRGT
ncbi:hypothetical protein BDN71DRAFT_801289 [Pleurotus eryngii]|uniref:Uncharacterized protein n=1 Tax=Pleurotus eryngii TaxID=5323 RepID=A0A9P6DGI8_PLEER|nr:hypothetical protein BDN71DRAFT_801289 [Pleurotus eryngii]